MDWRGGRPRPAAVRYPATALLTPLQAGRTRRCSEAGGSKPEGAMAVGPDRRSASGKRAVGDQSMVCKDCRTSSMKGSASMSSMWSAISMSVHSGQTVRRCCIMVS